ncbi:glycosyl hydrolase family 28-related protein [Catellatospora citrea]|uniref:Mycodextranase n=1 Tax=Catellatospora citrea TaxID=53366 RepID=A0A8J3K2P3_9ACTN|nr:glycosyl hydrolase family 28-related protein [Catellatospora citrea]RKE07411.1 ASPM-SPD-2-Hydin domain-containing protein [Catellatospora citrea]GIF95567.1 mycodextranase [Catellatospora citrea]
MKLRTALLAATTVAAAGVLAATNATAAVAGPALPTVPTLPGTALPLPVRYGAPGAAVPFTEYEAEHARTDGRVLAATRAFTQLAAEASGRRAVALDAGEWVEFTLAKPANAVDVRYSVPDGTTGSLTVTANGKATGQLALTAKYAHVYGNYPYTNDPADRGRHHYFDDARTMFDRTLPAGTRVRLKASATTVVDLADFEVVAAAPAAPADHLNALDFGADPTGATDSGAGLQAAIDAARDQQRSLWIPSGDYTVTRHLQVDRVTVRGAGPWHTVLRGAGVGVFGNAAPNPSTDVHLSGFAVFGETVVRDDATVDSGFGGSLSGSTISNVWVEHVKVGMWFDGPSEGLTIDGGRIKNVWADGLNLHDGVSRSTVSNLFVRNTGDDGMAMWSAANADTGNSFTRNTVSVPLLANGFAVYGGRDNTVRDNVAADTVTQGGGVHVGNRFGANPLAGTTTISGNLLVRTGSLVPNEPTQIAALWFWAADAPLTGAVQVRDTTLLDSSYAGMQFFGKSITNVSVERVTVAGAGTVALQLQAPGAASFAKVVAFGLGDKGVHDCASGFAVTRGAGNLGWNGTRCGFAPAGQLEIAQATGVEYGFQPIGTEAVRPVAITNPGPKPVTIEAVVPPRGYTVDSGCAVIAVGATCTLQVRFAPAASGNYAGLLTIHSTSPAGPYVVGLKGIGFDPEGNLALGRDITSSSEAGWWIAPPNLVDGDQSTYFESLNGAFPQTVTLDLGHQVSVSRIVLKLPANWGGRWQTIAVSADGAPLVGAAEHLFAPEAGNVVTIAFPAVTARELTLTFTSNTGWPAAQISEFEVYAH